MEGIDPHHESLFCALKVAEVVGRRLRLRFIGYPEKYDFWTTVDSPFLFPVGWCAQNKRRLQPPKPFVERGQAKFDWSTFLAKEKLTAVPRHLFRVPWDCPPNDSPAHMFRIGHKLEAVDKRNPGIACVATVKDSIGDYVLIHFDGWNASFDQWAHITSELLHPVGYCEDQELVLSIPAEWSSRPSGFTWKQYLKETNAKPVPKEAFERLPKLGSAVLQLQVGQRLEAVDRRCPQLIRVANVVSLTPPGFVTIGYDGWPDKYNVRIECSSSDLFPVGYCQVTGHPLQPPIRYDPDSELNGVSVDTQSSSSTSSITGAVCPTVGCKGYGHVKGPRYSTHQRVSGCPYSDLNLTRDLIRPHERLTDADIAPHSPDSPNSIQMPKLEQAVPLHSDCDSSQVSQSGPCLSPDSTMLSVPRDSSVQLLTTNLASVDPFTQTISVPNTLSNHNCVPNTVVHSVGFNGTCTSTVVEIPSHARPPVNTSIYDIGSVSLSHDQRTHGSFHPMPLDLSILGKAKLPTTIEINNLATSQQAKQSTVRKTEEATVSVPPSAISSAICTVNPSMTVQSPDSMTSPTLGIRDSNTSAPLSFFDATSQPVATASKRPASSNYPRPETKPRLASIANAANEYARQQQMFGLTGLPVKRKRGRPRKYGSLNMVSNPPISRSTPVGPSTSLTRNGMPPIPLYNSSTRINTINMQQNTTVTTSSAATVTVPAIGPSTMMPALSIYTPLTVGAPLPGLYSAGLLFPGTTLPVTNNDQTNGSISPATWSHADSSSIGCMITASTSGPHSDVTEPAISRSPNHSDNVVLPSEFSHPSLSTVVSSNIENVPSSHIPHARGDERRNSDLKQHSTGDPLVASEPQKFPEAAVPPVWSHDRFSESTITSGLPTYFYLPNHNYLDSVRNAPPMDLYSCASSPPGFVDVTGQRGDFDLMGRLVPQAGAALRASKAVGLTGPHSWNVDMVSSFVSTIPGCKQFATKFIDNEIDGAALLCLEQHDLMHVLGMKLGPAVKVAGAIHTLRRSLMSTPLTDLGPEYANAVAAGSSCFDGSHTVIKNHNEFVFREETEKVQCTSNANSNATQSVTSTRSSSSPE